jgi:hypothetical protein
MTRARSKSTQDGQLEYSNHVDLPLPTVQNQSRMPAHDERAHKERYAGEGVDQEPVQHSQNLQPAVEADVRHGPVQIRVPIHQSLSRREQAMAKAFHFDRK